MTRNTKHLRIHLAVVAAAVTLAAGPELVTLSRAITTLPATAGAVVWGRAHGGTCETHRDLFVTCSDLDGGYANAATTVGSVWLYGDLDGPERHRHEARHADQWALFGIAFPAFYGGESLRTRGDFCQNVFERWAGLHDGGYGRCTHK